MTKNKIFDFITNELKNHNVVLFMKGTSDSPMCGFSAMVVNILRSLKVNFREHNILTNESLRQGVKDFSDWPTIPQLYFKGEFVGGCDIICEMHKNKSLSQLLKSGGNQV